MRLLELDKIARRQHGVVARTQTRLTSEAWRRGIASGALVEVHRGVARLEGTADTAEQRIAAAVLAGGRGARASHRSAALLFGIPTADPTAVDIAVPTRGDGHSPHMQGHTISPRRGVTIHRRGDLRGMGAQRVRGIACTDILRTLVDLGEIDAPAVHGAVGHVLANDLTTPDAIASTLARKSGEDRRGVNVLRDAFDGWRVDAKPPDSVLEPAMHRLVAHYGLPPIEFHARVGGREVDGQLTGTPIVIECDGWRYHRRNPDQLERVRHDDAEFATRGWTVLRFSYRKITTRPSEVADQIRRSITRWTEHAVA